MTPKARRAAARSGQVAGDLHRLVEALDRRVKRPERPAEARIARESATLRASAINRLRSMKGRPPTS